MTCGCLDLQIEEVNLTGTLVHLCDINTARMKYDYALGSVVPQPIKECISLELLQIYCPDQMTVREIYCKTASIKHYIEFQLCHGCTSS